MINKNEDAFLKSIKGASPIKKNNKLARPVLKNKLEGLTKKTARTNLINTQTKAITQNTSPSHLKIQKTTINKKLKKGRMPIDKKIDFHGLSVFEAEILFSETVKNCYKKNLRCLLFVTGKGVLKKNKEEDKDIRLYYGKIRNSFISWTKKNDVQQYILSVEQANIEHGADGAFFVYLRKKKF